MLRFVVLISTILAVALGGVINSQVPQLDGRIVGGKDTTIESFPYQVSVRLLGSHICGGSILNSRTIVTASHCIYSISASYYSIQYGSTIVGGSSNVITAERLLKHEEYNSNTIDHDVALIFLRSDIPFSSRAQPIELASVAPAPGTPAVVTGWGTLTENGSSPTILQEVEVLIVDNEVCAKEYNDVNVITERMLCAGVNGGGQDACQGDSGGPLAANGQLVGVVSWGVGCARPEYSGVYSNVANLRSWIEKHTA